MTLALLALAVCAWTALCIHLHRRAAFSWVPYLAFALVAGVPAAIARELTSAEFALIAAAAAGLVFAVLRGKPPEDLRRFDTGRSTTPSRISDRTAAAIGVALLAVTLLVVLFL